jgi:cyclopropane-fatty-acyl-phospholipid synthase
MAIIEYVLNRLIKKGTLSIVRTDGSTLEFGGGPGSEVTMRLHDKNLLSKLAQDFTLHLGEAYMDGRFTIDPPCNLYDLMELFAVNYHEAPIMPWDFISELISPITRHIQQTNSRASSRRNVAHHYDISADFFKLILDKDMQYSCAYFKDPSNDLDTAQLDKRRLIASKLLLKPGMKVLDIGCGYGGLAIYLAKTFGVEVTGITLSEEQFAVAKARARQEGLSHKVNFRIQDYREEKGQYDRIVSVGMFEHVGPQHYREFFKRMKSLLTKDGVALLHYIGRMDIPGEGDNWILKYIFPGGYVPAFSEVMPKIEKSGLWVTDIEILRMHYAYTLMAWRANFERNRDIILKMYDERFCRMWEYFLIGAEFQFRYGRMVIFQLQITRDLDAVPLTRDYMFEAQKATEKTITPPVPLEVH